MIQICTHISIFALMQLLFYFKFQLIGFDNCGHTDNYMMLCDFGFHPSVIPSLYMDQGLLTICALYLSFSFFVVLF